MEEPGGTGVQYAAVPELITVLRYAAEELSLEFDMWEEPYVQGPSLYFLVVAGTDTESFADPLGENRWPVEIADHVTRDEDRFVEAARDVAFSRDGAVVVSADGTITEQMVRVTSREGDGPDDRRESVDFADWMGTKHLSAVEATVRDEVLAAVTLSEESGRVSVFSDGAFDDTPRGQLGAPWRSDLE